MGRRLELQKRLEDVLGSRNVYYQPPEEIKMQYPAIVYHPAQHFQAYSNDRTYTFVKQYTITYIYRDADTGFIEDLIYAFPMIRHDRHFVVDNLYHDVFSLYF